MLIVRGIYRTPQMYDELAEENDEVVRSYVGSMHVTDDGDMIDYEYIHVCEEMYQETSRNLLVLYISGERVLEFDIEICPALDGDIEDAIVNREGDRIPIDTYPLYLGQYDAIMFAIVRNHIYVYNVVPDMFIRELWHLGMTMES